ncbi:MAG: TRAP transporter large permease subunit, partial [Deltaproteobacteria bacterium]|nr:TRAP transporter large permease subunit [Deltaproteobacteria bacterium]
SGVIVPIIAMSLPLAQTLASLQVPQAFVSFMTSLTSNPYLIIIIMIAILMIAGCVMETTPNIVILAPLLLPLAQEIGMDEVHFCIFMVSALGIGFITPPLGLNLFVVSGVTQTPIIAISRYVIPFVLTMLVVVLLLGYIPWLSLWLIR